MKTRYLVIAVLALLVSCKGGDKQAELVQLKKERDKLNDKIALIEKELMANDTTPKGTLVAIEQLKNSSFSHFIEIQGRLDGDQNVAVYPETQGIVTEVLVKAGQHVSKGQLLARLDDAVLRQSVHELQTSLELATKLYDKQKALWDQKIGSEVQFLQAKNNKESLESKLAQVRKQLDMSQVKSPISGSVEEAPLRAGQMASPAVPAFRVVNFGTIKIVADVAESYASRINVGDAVNVFFPDINKEISAKVDYASKYINPVNRTFQIEVRVPGSSIDLLKANMVAYVRVNDYKKDNALSIPINFVQNDQSGSYVYLAVTEGDKKVARKVDIKLGKVYNGLAEITSGLKLGDNLITTGYLDLENGDQIQF
jgi:RND family efflux transporter MFP subunit